MMLANLRIIMIAVFITASYRLVPLPIGDVERAFVISVLAFLISNLRPTLKLDISFYKIAWPLLTIMVLSLVLDALLGRTGLFTWIIWVKFLSAILVAAAVYTLSFKEMHRLILVAIVLLVTHLALISWAPSYFISTARALGIVDPFVTYGASLVRNYYAYFSASSASYAIYYLLLMYFALQLVIAHSNWRKAVVISTLVLLALLTGGRGVIVLTLAFCILWLAAFRSTRTMVLTGVTLAGVAAALPLYNAFLALFLLREESNVARFNAFKNYLGVITDNPVLGIGINAIRERVVVYGFKPSHNFFIETLATFGILVGGALIVYLFFILVVNPRVMALRVVGIFALLVGVFNNTLLTHWGFFPLLYPVLLKLSNRVQTIQPYLGNK